MWKRASGMTRANVSHQTARRQQSKPSIFRIVSFSSWGSCAAFPICEWWSQLLIVYKDWIYNTRFALNSAPLTVAAKSTVVVRGLRRWAIRRIPWLEWYACQQPLIWPVTSSNLSRPFWYIFTDLPWLLLYVSDMLRCLYVPVRSWWRSNAIVCYWGVCVCEWAASVQVKPENFFMSLCSGAMHALWAMVQQSSQCTCRYRSWIYRKPKKCSMTVQVCARLCGVLRWFRRKISWHWHSFPQCRVMRHHWGICSTTIPLPLGEWHRRWPVVTGVPSYSIKVGLNILFLSHAIERSTCMHIPLFS